MRASSFAEAGLPGAEEFLREAEKTQRPCSRCSRASLWGRALQGQSLWDPSPRLWAQHPGAPQSRGAAWWAGGCAGVCTVQPLGSSFRLWFTPFLEAGPLDT